MELYGKENVLNDMREVKRLKDIFDRNHSPIEKEALKAAQVFEAIVLDQAEMNEWLGSNVTVLKTSMYDDLKNGIDMVAEWHEDKNESKVLALAVDVTFSTRKMEQKFLRIRRDIDRGKMGTIKYFKTSDGSFMGRRENVPKVVIGVSRNAVRELAAMWTRRDNTSLAAHPVQRALLDEIMLQLDTVIAYAKTRNEKVSDAYRKARETIVRIREAKKSVALGSLANDAVYSDILNRTLTTFKA